MKKHKLTRKPSKPRSRKKQVLVALTNLSTQEIAQVTEIASQMGVIALISVDLMKSVATPQNIHAQLQLIMLESALTIITVILNKVMEQTGLAIVRATVSMIQDAARSCP